MSHQMLPIAFFPDRPPLPWQRNLGQNGLSLGLRRRFLRDFCACRDGPSNAVNCIFFDRPPLPWQRNLGQNWL